MADKTIDIVFKEQLSTASADAKKIQSDGGFSGKVGTANFNKVQSIIDSLSKLGDVSNLKPEALKDALNKLAELWSMLDKASKGLSTYSDAYKKQQQKVEEANTKLSAAQDKHIESLKKQEEAYNKITNSEATFINKKTGYELKDARSITEAYSKKQLDIYDKDKTRLLSGAALTNVTNNLDAAKSATEEVAQAKQDIKDAKIEVKQATLELKQTPQGGELHDTTKLVGGHADAANKFIGRTKESLGESMGTTNAAMSISTTTAALNKQTTSLGKAFKAFSIYNFALRNLRRAVNSAIKTIKDLDKYLTEQAMVTGKTRQETYALLGDYQKMASELGATTKEIAQVSTQFIRQGKSTADALKLTRAAVSAAKVAGITGAESVNYLTTALNGFQLAAEDAMKVSDKFAAIAAQSATSYQEIATALSKVASQANIAGMSIDYTTALLAKGIETTREPAESIGTALKTIIARMRELTDYGKTLEDGMNINNVETQLAYVGIALRNTNGELRSTEEVLDELGGKWDTLSSNQQAAVAKALAGTRQQSRLIAMMTDYERVTELQEIAQRSAGATAAQAAVYMEGMEAALNKVSVAWEKIVTAVTNSDVIINFIDGVSQAMDLLGDFLNTTAGIVSSIGIIAVIGLTILGQKMMEMQLAREQRKLQLQRQRAELEYNYTLAQTFKAKHKESAAELRSLAVQAKQTALKAKEAVAAAKIALAEGRGSIELVEAAEAESQIADMKAREAESLAQQAASSEYVLSTYSAQNALLTSQESLVGKLSTGIYGLLSPLYMVLGAWNMIKMSIKAVQAARTRAHKKAVKEDTEETVGKAPKAGAEIIGQLGVYGIPIAAAVMMALAGVALGVTAAYNAANAGTEKAADKVNKLSNEIYKLQAKADAIKSIEKQYDNLDKKIIQTTEDQKKMNDLLNSISDKLSEEEKNVFESLTTDKAKRDYLETVEEDAIEQANKKRQKQIQLLGKLDAEQRREILNNKDNADYLQVVDAIYAINNNTLYEYIDSLGSVNDGVEKFTQNILENLSAEEAWKLASEDTTHAVERLVNAVNDATTIIGDDEVSLATILDSTKYSLQEKIEAYNQLHDEIASLGDKSLIDSFEAAYGQWETLQHNMSKTAIQFMDSIGVSIDKLNEFGLTLNKLGIETEDATSRISELFKLIAEGTDVSTAITSLFNDILSAYEPNSKDWKALYNRILNAYQKAAGTGMLNMGQNLTSLQSQINSLYEKASKWNSLSLTEQTEFIQDNYELFQGAGGQKLFEAFQTGNYNAIRDALATNDVLKEQIRLRLEQLKVDLQIAEAASDRNEAEIKWIKDQIKILEGYEKATAQIYQADLKLRLEQENKQLDLYKSYLEKEKDALTESLDKRKEAYQKYFDEINKEQEAFEYEEKADILTSNLSKLSSSTDAASMSQRKELEQQLQELEKERLQTLREQTQEAVLNNLDTEVSQINDKFDKLLENQAALLAVMQKDIASDPENFTKRVLAAGIMNMTATQAEDFIKNDFVPAYNSEISPEMLEGISVRQEGTSLFLTLNNKEVEISETAQQDLSAAILKALRELGISI